MPSDEMSRIQLSFYALLEEKVGQIYVEIKSVRLEIKDDFSVFRGEFDKKADAIYAEIKSVRLELQERMDNQFSALIGEIAGLQQKVDDKVDGLRKGMEVLRVELKGDIDALRSEFKSDIDGSHTELKGDIGTLRSELNALRVELKGDIDALRSELKGDIANLRVEINELKEGQEKLYSRIDSIEMRQIRLEERIPSKWFIIGIMLSMAGLIVTLMSMPHIIKWIQEMFFG